MTRQLNARGSARALTDVSGGKASLNSATRQPFTRQPYANERTQFERDIRGAAMLQHRRDFSMNGGPNLMRRVADMIGARSARRR